MTFLHANAPEMNCLIDQGITGILAIIQITSQILLSLFLAKFVTIRTSLLMSTNPRWKRLLELQQNQHSSQQTESGRCSALTRVPKGSHSPPLRSCKQYSTEKEQPSEAELDQVRTPASSSNLKVSTRQRITTDDLNVQIHNESLVNDRRRKVGCIASRCLVPCTSRFSTAPSLTDTISNSVTLSPTPTQSSIRGTWRGDDEQGTFLRGDRFHVTRHKTIPRSDNEEPKRPAILSYRVAKHKEISVSNQPSTPSQKQTTTNESPNKNKTPVSNTKVTSLARQKRPKPESLLRAKSHHKPDVSKVPVSVKLRKRHLRRKTRTDESKTSETSSSSSDELDSICEPVGVKLVTAAGQHGFLKNVGTGSDSTEPSFTTVKVDEPTAELVPVELKKTQVVGTSIPEELLLKRGVYYPHPSHRSVCIQADGSYKTPGDSRSLFQRLLPRINSLGSTKRRQDSLNASSSGQSCYTGFLSSSVSRTYPGSRSDVSASERPLGSSVDVHYGPSGNVRAVLRVSSNTGSRYSSRSSAVWSRSGDRLTPIIQGVSLSPPRTPSNQQNQTLIEASTSVATSKSRKTGASKKRL